MSLRIASCRSGIVNTTALAWCREMSGECLRQYPTYPHSLTASAVGMATARTGKHDRRRTIARELRNPSRSGRSVFKQVRMLLGGTLHGYKRLGMHELLPTIQEDNEIEGVRRRG